MIPKTTTEITTTAMVWNGVFSCYASVKEDELLLVNTRRDGWRIRIPVDDVLSIIEALGGAYDWRKRKIAESIEKAGGG